MEIKFRKNDFRRDIKDFFECSGIREYSKYNHHPAIVFNKKANGYSIEIVDNPYDLLSYKDDTEVIMQWSGKWSSDFFRFTIKELKEYISKNPKKDYYSI